MAVPGSGEDAGTEEDVEEDVEALVNQSTCESSVLRHTLPNT